MRIHHSAREIGDGSQKLCLAIGFFDGVHLGHQQIIGQTVADARQHESLAVAITFDVHPNTVVAPKRVPLLIHSLDRKIRRIQSHGPDALWLIHFDEPFSRQSGEAFVRSLVTNFNSIRSICVGANFVFGHKRSGNIDLLRRLGAELGFAVHGVAAVALNGRNVSSTRIREAIACGDFDSAGQMLGRSYCLAGRVTRGDALGRQLGFPTANIDTTGLVLPPHGVYAVQARTGRQLHRAVLNIGFRPTVQSAQPQLRVEAHLLDFDNDLYGQELEIFFVEKLRDEQKFDSLTALQAQIARDIQAAQSRF